MTKIKYYRDVLTLRTCLPFIIFILIFFTLPGIAFYFNLDYSIQNISGLIFLYLFFSLILYILIINLLKKVAIDENGNISILGNGIKHFILNTYYRSLPEATDVYYNFNKNNIKKIEIINYSDVKKIDFKERYYLTKTSKVILIEFKEPLMHFANVLTIGKMNSLNRIYISLNNPEEFIRDIKRIK